MGTTRKAPSGVKHARCVHHEAYPTAPAGWLCFSNASAPTDDDILERMTWADDIETARAGHRLAWATFQAETPPAAVLMASSLPAAIPTSTLRARTEREQAEAFAAECATTERWADDIRHHPDLYSRRYGFRKAAAS